MPDVTAKVTLHLDHVNVVVEKATDEALAALALQIAGQTTANIVNNNQIDTGFMMNSVYAISRRDNTYKDTDPTGEYRSRKTGQQVRRKLAPEQRLPSDAAAAVIVGASYAIYQEQQDSFLFKAAEQVARDAGGICEPVYREQVHD